METVRLGGHVLERYWHEVWNAGGAPWSCGMPFEPMDGSPSWQGAIPCILRHSFNATALC
jgi:hypothetical protein